MISAARTNAHDEPTIAEVRSANARIQSCLRDSAALNRDIERIGPFLATFSRSSGNPFLNYAVPDQDARPSADEVQALIQVYEQRDLRPRLEYISSYAPRVEAAL